MCWLRLFLLSRCPGEMELICNLCLAVGRGQQHGVVRNMPDHSRSDWWLAHESPFYGKTSGHDYHHLDTKDFSKKAMEFFSDTFASGGFLLIVNIILNINCIYLFDNYAILLFMFGFPLVHFFNYHYLIPKSYHHYHHKEPNTNFSPDFYDHLFNSNQGEYFEDNSHMLPVFLIVDPQEAPWRTRRPGQEDRRADWRR